ncbi:MAG: aryl-sulfate sulfotransferase, partial [Planctomycetaceae bacterium]
MIDLNYVPKAAGADTHIADWAHFNSIDYNATTDQVMVSVREFCEIRIVDHSTTTEQAAGHDGGNDGEGGDLLWRYGNNRAWNGGSRQTLYWQHNAQWITSDLPDAGNILVYNNGWFRNNTGRSYSSVMELRQSPSAYGVASVEWSFSGPPSFFSPIVSGTQRLPNGNTLVDVGATGTLFEVTASKRVVWRYVNPDTVAGPVRQGSVPAALNVTGTPGVRMNITFRAVRYAPTYSG